MLDFVGTDKKGGRHAGSRVIDIPWTEKTIEALMKGGRWHIENQTFNTLKKQDYPLSTTTVTVNNTWPPTSLT